MVQLSFTVLIEKDFETVWNYFSEFSNITKWDPNTTGCQCLKSTPEKIGSQYMIKTLFNDNQSQVLYKTQKYRRDHTQGYLSLWGQNDMITAFDEIICRPKGINTTEMVYQADICLKGFKVLFTPFILCSLNKITEIARVGCRNKARELWGKAQ